MHDGQVDLTTDQVSALVGTPVTPVVSHGTVNALFRADDIVFRFPLKPVADPTDLIAEQDHARRIAPHVPVQVPEPLALGEPGEGYAGYWTAWRWIDGDLPDGDVAPADLAAFVRALHRIDTAGQTWNGRGRGGPLRLQDDWVRHSLRQSEQLIDTAGLTGIWDAALATPAFTGPDGWIHTDLMPGNLLVRDGRLAAVIDLGGVVAGDPAADYMPAWNLFDPDQAQTYRNALGADDDAWQRGRGWTLVQGIGALWYYQQTNPRMAATARHTLTALLATE